MIADFEYFDDTKSSEHNHLKAARRMHGNAIHCVRGKGMRSLGCWFSTLGADFKHFKQHVLTCFAYEHVCIFAHTYMLS